MSEVSVKRTLAVPARKVWDLISDFGDVSWMPAGTPAVVEGSGPGMARVIGGGERKIREVLEARDAVARTLTYTIPEGVPFPVTGYRSTMLVSDAGDGCELEWRCSFEPAGVSEEQAAAAIEGMYGVMIGWVAERAAQI
jgi:hypothetical protein